MSQIETVSLNLAFKGGRDYLHGTDMYDAIIDSLRNAAPLLVQAPFSMSIHEFARSQCDLLYTIAPDCCPKPDDGRVEFSLASGVSGWLRETGRPVQESRPYPEDEIVASSKIEGNAIVAGALDTFSAIEILVANTKRLHSTLRGSEEKWAFTRLDLERPLERSDADGFKIELSSALGNRLTKSIVSTGRQVLGHIFFSAIRT